MSWLIDTLSVVTQVDEGGLKADQWRNLVSVLVVALYVAWQIHGEIPDMDAPRPKSSTKAAKGEARKETLLAKRRRDVRARDENTNIADLVNEDDDNGPTLTEDQAKMSRNYREHYQCVLDHCSAVRIYASQSITPNEIQRAARNHSRACQSWARMNCHLTPNFHLSEHNPDALLAYGPPYGYWGYPMEQHNGFLKKFRHNGHAGGELEATLMRGWIKYSLMSDLVRLSCVLSTYVSKSWIDTNSRVS